jgi:methionyl-tRNA formyltransferase
MMRILFFGDGAWAAGCLRRLSADGHEILGVLERRRPTSPDLSAAAASMGFPTERLDVNAPAFVARATALAPDLNLSVSYDQILRPPIRETARLGFVNLHAGKLPLYRGRNVINWAIINGETELGITAHAVDDGIDTGDILLQRTLPISWTDGYGDVLARAVAAFPDLASDVVSALERGTAARRPQAHLPGSYFPGRQEGDEWLNWSETSENLHNKIRAITRPGPGARTRWERETVILWKAHYERDWPRYRAVPGAVVGRDASGVLVKTGDSTLQILEIQGERGGPRVPTWPIGTRLVVDPIALAAEMETSS